MKTIVIQSKHIIPREEQKIQLNSNQRYQIFSYDINDNVYNSDLVLRLSIGNGYTTKIYIYQNANLFHCDNGIFTGFNWEFIAKENEYLIHSYQRDYSIKTMMIIFNDEYYAYNDYFQIIEECELIPLELNSPIIIDKFYHLNYYELYYVSNRMIGNYSLQVNSEKLNVKGTLEILVNNSTWVLYSSNEFPFQRVIEISKEDNILIRVISNDSSYIEKEICIMLSPIKEHFLELKQERTIKENVVLTSQFYYYVDLYDYHLNDEGVVATLFNQKEVINHDIKITIYGKLIGDKAHHKNNFGSEIFPFTLKENKFELIQDSSNHFMYHMHFKKYSNNDNYLLLYYKFEVKSVIKPLTFTVSLGKKYKVVTFHQNLFSTNSFQAKPNIPYNYKIAVNKEHIGQNILIQSSIVNTMTVFYDTQTNERIVKIYHRILSNEGVIKIKLMTPFEQIITLSIRISNATIVNIKNYRQLYMYTENNFHNCFQNVFFLFTKEHYELYENENVIISKLEAQYDFVRIDSFDLITQEFRESIGKSLQREIGLKSLLDIDQQILLLQCKRLPIHIQFPNQDITYKIRDFSIEINWKHHPLQRKNLHQLYLIQIKNNNLQSNEIDSIIQSTNPYKVFTTNTQSYLIYPIQAGQYHIILISFYQSDHKMHIEQYYHNQSILIIPSIFPMASYYVIIIVSLITILIIILLIQKHKHKKD